MISLQNSPDLSISHEKAYQRIWDWLHDRCCIFYQDNKKQLLIQRMQGVCVRHGIPDLETLADILESGRNRDITLAVMHAATTNHTYFFREPQVLDFFLDVILPGLPKSGGHIWSAASSTGDEAYTLAIMATQIYGRDWVERNLVILGTDLSNVVIAHAEAGIYSECHLDQMPGEILERYFDPVGMAQYRVRDDLRSICIFRLFNLKSIPYPFHIAFHAVFCRNVLYYFDRVHQQAIVEAIYDITEPGGWLLTSVTESLRDLDTRWIPIRCGIYRKAG